MYKKGDLYQVMLSRDSSEALYITCQILKSGNVQLLEDEWIAMTATIGKKDGFNSGSTWSVVNQELLQILEADHIKVGDALLCTAKLMLLNQRDTDVESLKNVQRLRNEVISFFPMSAALSPKGNLTFAEIIPNDTGQTHELYEFCQRILAGFSKLMTEENCDAIRNATEYISRKKITIPLPNKWPAPTKADADSGDSCWFLWGAFMCFYRSHPHILMNWQLFCWNWRKSVRNDRIGLLWGLAYCIYPKNQLIWTPEEIGILERVSEYTKELWTFVLAEDKTHQKTANVSVFEAFEPRYDNVIDYTSFSYSYSDDKEPIRTLDVHEKRSNSLGNSSNKETKIKKIEHHSHSKDKKHRSGI